jgi:hypothetical protein
MGVAAYSKAKPPAIRPARPSEPKGDAMFALLVFFVAAGQLHTERGPNYASAAACEQATAEAAAFIRRRNPDVEVVEPVCLPLGRKEPAELTFEPEVLSPKA